MCLLDFAARRPCWRPPAAWRTHAFSKGRPCTPSVHRSAAQQPLLRQPLLRKQVSMHSEKQLYHALLLVAIFLFALPFNLPVWYSPSLLPNPLICGVVVDLKNQTALFHLCAITLHYQRNQYANDSDVISITIQRRVDSTMTASAGC